MKSLKSMVKRGAFIVFEGCDRSGKSTQSCMLIENLRKHGVSCTHMVFPARDSEIGKEINAYLKNSKELSDHVIHLLFTANRWEFRNEIERILQSGTTIVVDRYSYSGVAYSAGKGLDYDWCFAPEKGLIKPDAVFFLKMSASLLGERGKFGEERYEKLELQKKVAEVYERIYEQEKSYWHCIDASSSINAISDEVYEKAKTLILEASDKPLKMIT